MFKFVPFPANTPTDNPAGVDLGSIMGMLLPFALILGAMYFFMMRPQKKQKQKEQAMRNNVRVGDEITTIGGICGRVLNIKEETLVIETGADRSKMTIKKWALSSVDTIHDDPDPDDDDDDDDDDL